MANLRDSYRLTQLLMKLLSTLAEQFTHHRRAFALLAIGTTLVTLVYLPQLQIDDNFNNLLKQSSQPGNTGLEVGSDDNTCLLLIEGDQVLASGNQEPLRELVTALTEVERVVAVHSIFDARKPVRFGNYFLPLIKGPPETVAELRELQEQALQHPLIAGKMLSGDGQTTLVFVELDPAMQSASEYKLVLNQLQKLAEQKLASSRLKANLTGIPALQVEMTESLKWEQVVFVSGAEVVGLLICLLIFRRLSAVLIVQAGPMTAVIWSLGFMAMAGEPLNVVNSVLAPLVLTIALTDSVHLLLRIRAEMEQGEARIAAVSRALYHVGPACFLTSLTTAIAFGSLATANIEVIRRFGWSCAFAVVAAFLAVITVVPLLACTRLGDHIVPVHGSKWGGKNAWNWLDLFVSRHRWALSVFSVGCTAILLLISMRLTPDIQMQQILPNYGTALKSLQRCDEVFGGLLPLYIIVDWDKTTTEAELLDAIREVEQLISTEPRLGSPISIVSVLQSLSSTPNVPVDNIANLKYMPPHKTNRLLQRSQRRAVVISRVRDVGTRYVMPLYADLRTHLDQLEKSWPQLNFRLSGWTLNSGRLSQSMIGDMMSSLYSAVLLSFIVLVVAFRSLKLGIVSLIPNLFPLVATSATMVLLDVPLHFSSATVFSVCFGIAVDDTIHFLWSFSHARREGDLPEVAVRRTLFRVGEALLASTMIMICAFGVVLFSNIPSIHEFAFVFIVVLGWAIVGDLLFLPAMLLILVHKPRKAEEVQGTDANMGP